MRPILSHFLRALDPIKRITLPGNDDHGQNRRVTTLAAWQSVTLRAPSADTRRKRATD
jgi:hypothetical protein